MKKKQTKKENKNKTDNEIEELNIEQELNFIKEENNLIFNNSTLCNNSAYLLYCSELVGEKFKVFNKTVKDKKAFLVLRDKILDGTGYRHPKQLTSEDKAWLKKNVKQFNARVLDVVIADSVLPDKPKEARV